LILSDSAPFLAAQPFRLGVAKPDGRVSRVVMLVMRLSSSTDGRDSVEPRRLVKDAPASPHHDGLPRLKRNCYRRQHCRRRDKMLCFSAAGRQAAHFDQAHEPFLRRFARGR
jgi:hypothetical protein